MKVEYSPRALTDLRDIAAYYASSDNLTGGEAVAARVQDVVARLELAPRSGRPVPDREGVRVAPLLRYSYNIFYAVVGETVRIVHIRRSWISGCLGPSRPSQKCMPFEPDAVFRHLSLYQWRGNLAHLMPARGKVHRVQHWTALNFDEVPALLAALQHRSGTASRALEFTIYTAARTGEVIGATWDEINLQAKIWTIPASRMKAGREHRVPLSAAALDVLEKVCSLALAHDDKPDPNAPVFPGLRRSLPLSSPAMRALLQRMGRGDLTVHGFRSSFSDWTAERTAYPREVVEMALAHAIGNRVEAAYRRGDLFEKRRQLMEAWARFCTSPATAAEVVSLHAGG